MFSEGLSIFRLRGDRRCDSEVGCCVSFTHNNIQVYSYERGCKGQRPAQTPIVFSSPRIVHDLLVRPMVCFRRAQEHSSPARRGLAVALIDFSFHHTQSKSNNPKFCHMRATGATNGFCREGEARKDCSELLGQLWAAPNCKKSSDNASRPGTAPPSMWSRGVVL